MHEMTIASAVLDTALETAAESGADRIDSLAIEVGAVTHLNPTQLARCIELMAEDTPASGADVETTTIEPRGACDCGWSGTPRTLDGFGVSTPDLTCPDCGDQLSLTEGRGCRLASISVPEGPTTQ